MKVNKTAVILISFFMLLGISFLGYYYTTMKQHPRRLPTYGNPGHKVGSFSFLNQDGKTITEKDLDGKIYVVEYFFTTCEGICPIMNENMVAVNNAFKNDNDFAILSHSVDPEVDTVAQMKKYSFKFDADPARWMFLTGNKDSLYKMAVDDYLIPVADSTVEKISPEFIHTQKFVLVDKEKNVRGFYDGTNKASVKKLIADIVELKKEYQ
jgi:protein SCO1/2